MLRRMAGHSWVEHSLAVVMLATAAYCGGRLVLPPLRAVSRRDRDADVAHVAMALAMAAMLTGVAAPVWNGPVVLLFAVPAIWFAVRSVHGLRTAGSLLGRHCSGGAIGHAQLCVASVAMVYMSGVVPGFGSASSAIGGKILSRPEGHHHGALSSESAAVTSGVPSVDFALVGALIVGLLAAFAVLNLSQLSASTDACRASVTQRAWTGRLAICCQLAMGATTAHMLVAML
jgi:hypothetical protein